MSSACLNINFEFYIKLCNAWQEYNSVRVINSEMFHVQAVPLEQFNLHMHLLLHDVGNFWCSKHLSQTSMDTLSRPAPAQPVQEVVLTA